MVAADRFHRGMFALDGVGPQGEDAMLHRGLHVGGEPQAMSLAQET